MKDIVIYGAGGLGREIEFLLKRINKTLHIDQWNFIGYVITDKLSNNSPQIIGDESWLLQEENKDVYIALGIGDAKARYKIGCRLLENISCDRFPILIDPSIIYDNSCIFQPGVIISPGTILTVNIIMEKFSFLNLNCTVGHDSFIGQGVVANPSVNISGNVNIKEGVLIGTGAQILQKLQIGAFSKVGAGAVVTKDVLPNKTMVGIPAKEL